MDYFRQTTRINMEPLIEIPRSKWLELRDLYRNDWPKDAVAFCFLDTQITYPTLAEFCNIRIYSPDGDVNNGFVAIYFNEMDVPYEIKVQPLKCIDKFENALAETKLDWNAITCVSSASPIVEDCFRGLGKRLGIKVCIKTEGYRCVKHFLDRRTEKIDIRTSPPDTYVAGLKPEHLRIVDETWTFHSDYSYKLFESLLRNQLIYVLYSTTDEPLAWVTISWGGTLTHLYCMENHRRKGYAEYILKYAVNDQLNKGKNVLGYTLEANVKAQKLFDKLNFKRIGYDTWITFN